MPLALVAPLLLAACSDAPGEIGPQEDLDPAVAHALNEPLMTDPDLVSSNEANAALTGSQDHSLPADIATPEAIREAQDRAVALLGGSGAVPRLPEPGPLSPEGEVSPLVMLEGVATQVPGLEKCLAGARYGFGWAALLPDSVPVFPRGATIEALGSDRQGCAFRAVRFRSPVPAEDLAAFYFGKASQGGYAVTYRRGDDVWQIEGRKGGARLLVRGRPSFLGHQEIDLVTGGAGPPAA